MSAMVYNKMQLFQESDDGYTKIKDEEPPVHSEKANYKKLICLCILCIVVVNIVLFIVDPFGVFAQTSKAP